MAGELDDLVLGDLVALTRGTTYQSTLLGQPGPVLLGLASIKRNGGFRDDNLKTYGGDCPEKLTLRPGDMYVSLKDVTQAAELLGAIARVPQHVHLGRVTQDTVKLTFLRDDISDRYIYWLLRTPAYREYCRSHAIGTTSLALPREDFLSYPVPRPQHREMALVEILDALDDKIELNRRMNATLEAMPRVLFQSWFVDFDPVRAKMDGREPVGLDPKTTACFPDSLHDSGAGHIPQHWTVGRMAEIVDFSRSSVDPSGFPDEIFDHYSLPAFDEGRTPKTELGSAIKSNKLVVARDSVLLSKLNPHIQRIWLPYLHSTRRSACSTEFIVTRPRDDYSREYLFSLFTNGAFSSTYCTLVTGTTGSHQRIHPESVLDMKIVNPPVHLVEAFTAIAKPMFDQINRNIEQSRALATLRDTLLSKLLNGDLNALGVIKQK